MNNLWFFLDLPWQQFVVVLIDRAATTTLLCSQSKMSLCDGPIIDKSALSNVFAKFKELLLPSARCSMLPLTVRLCYATLQNEVLRIAKEKCDSRWYFTFSLRRLQVRPVSDSVTDRLITPCPSLSKLRQVLCIESAREKSF